MNLTLADATVIIAAFMSLFSFIKVLRSPIDRIDSVERDVKLIKDDLNARKQIDRAILNSLQAITNHSIDGNGIEELKASKKELQHTIVDIATK